ncbi:MAG TPA: YggS family pyridoxal phosphate-dependent enzyme [Lapillicoccus sp.]|nr:YggS family pyridoxal phosphate-dependent enzyme [Lapillicoccus sp.]
MTTGDARRDEIAHRLDDVHTRIATACGDAGRDPSSVELVVVTKFFPVSDVRRLADLGVRDVGENRDQEARVKLTDSLLDGTGLRRHFIGQLQSNKAASVVSYADVVHTADRAKVVRALGTAADRQGRRPRVLVQVSLDDAPGRGGAVVQDVPALADLVAAEPALELGGVMAVAPLEGDPDAAFARLLEVATRIQAAHPDATWVSAGMSEDLEAAIRHGATLLRVGSAILGSRPPLR